jgi:hypothetical protein
MTECIYLHGFPFECYDFWKIFDVNDFFVISTSAHFLYNYDAEGFRASKHLIRFQNSIPFRLFSSLGHTLLYVAFHGMALRRWKVPWLPPYEHICGCFEIQNFTTFMLKCWILLKSVIGGVDGSLFLTVPSMNRLNQTEPWTFSIMPFGLSYEILIFSILLKHF